MEAPLSSTGFSIVFLLGAVQGLFLAAVLASRRRNSVANKILAAAMLVFSIDLGTAAYHATGFAQDFPHLIGLDYPVTFLYGPLIYLYARTVSTREQVLKRTYLLHFVPFALVVGYLLPFYLQPGAEKLAFLQTPAHDPRAPVLAVVNHLKIGHALVYVACTIRVLQRHRHRIKDNFSSLEHINLTWLRNLTVGIVGLSGLTAGLYVWALQGPMPVMGMDAAETYDDVTLLAVTIFVYTIGYLGLRQPEIFAPRPLARATAAAPAALAPVRAAAIPWPDDLSAAPSPDPTPDIEKPQYAKSGMEPEAAQQYMEALWALMETEKPYRQGDLTLQDLAEALAISPHNLSEVINTQAGQNFYDFVNGYRVREVQARLTDPSSAHLTLLAIGLDAGFNSKSSFNAVFKKHTQMTPSQYRQHVCEDA